MSKLKAAEAPAIVGADEPLSKKERIALAIYSAFLSKPNMGNDVAAAHAIKAADVLIAALKSAQSPK